MEPKQLKALKDKTMRTLKAAHKMTMKGYAIEERALNDYARRACPFKKGDIIKARDHAGRLGYWSVLDVSGVGGSGFNHPRWRVDALACKANGELAMRRSRCNFREDGTVAQNNGLSLHIKAKAAA